mmetsp:Transcript_26966/g.53986  ORF Transcript_26966/g.53986 Transcript_26966/m.53986 type:complete len:205 (-) Transcript_26966:2688-3302(-)
MDTKIAATKHRIFTKGPKTRRATSGMVISCWGKRIWMLLRAIRMLRKSLGKIAKGRRGTEEARWKEIATLRRWPIRERRRTNHWRRERSLPRTRLELPYRNSRWNVSVRNLLRKNANPRWSCSTQQKATQPIIFQPHRWNPKTSQGMDPIINHMNNQHQIVMNPNHLQFGVAVTMHTKVMPRRKTKRRATERTSKSIQMTPFIW